MLPKARLISVLRLRHDRLISPPVLYSIMKISLPVFYAVSTHYESLPFVFLLLNFETERLSKMNRFFSISEASLRSSRSSFKYYQESFEISQLLFQGYFFKSNNQEINSKAY